MFYQLVGNVVQYAVAVLDNRCQFQGQPVFHDFGERVSVNGMGIVIAHFHQFIVGAGNFRVVGFPFLRQRLQNFALLCNLPGIGHNDFNGFILGKVGEFIQHFLGSTDVYRGMGFDFPRLFPVGKKNVPISLVFSKHVMGIGGGTHRAACLFPDFNDLPVQILQVFFGIHIAEFIFVDKNFIISKGLHFQVIVKFCLFNEFLITFPGQDGAEKFTHHAGGAVNEAFVIFFQNGLGNERPLPVELQMGQGNHAVQVAEACNVFRQDNDMVVLLAVGVRIFRNLIDHVPFHAVNYLLVVPFGGGLDDFFVINETVKAHLCMKMELHPGGGIVVFMVDDLGFSLFYLQEQEFQCIAAGILVIAHIAPHLDYGAGLQ